MFLTVFVFVHKHVLQREILNSAIEMKYPGDVLESSCGICSKHSKHVLYEV